MPEPPARQSPRPVHRPVRLCYRQQESAGQACKSPRQMNGLDGFGEEKEKRAENAEKP